MVVRLLLFIIFSTSGFVFAQNPEVSGRVTDASSGEPLVGVNVFYSHMQGVATDASGFYAISATPGKVLLQFRFIGYNTLYKELSLIKGQKLILNIAMDAGTSLLNEVVVSASRYEEKISDVIVSMEVLSSATVENTHTVTIETALQQVPGVMFMDDQVSIRSGNGYSYGVGSRVLLLLDDLPMLTGGGGEAKWDFVPLENLSQIEVLKGASSALYGSSALNGVINIRTAYPGEKPETSAIAYSGVYGNPKREEIAWWDKQPYYAGIRLSHSRRIGNFDLVGGANVNTDKGYRENENKKFIRLNLNTRYRSRKIKGLAAGINTNAMFSEGGNFLLWLDGDSGVYKPSPDFDQRFRNTRFNLDPHITWFRDNNSRHSLKGRYYKVTYDGDSLRNYDDTWFAEYQYMKRWDNGFSLTAGSSAMYVLTSSNLFGNVKHRANNHSFYFQTEKSHQKWRFSLGGRYELHAIDNQKQESKPLIRAGANYQAGKFTFLRTNFGQGFRYPAIAEKYAATEVGALKIFPNDTLKPEYGWNAEVGVKQGFQIGRIQGYADAALFWTEYENMIEFTFGQHYPPGMTDPTLIDFFSYTGFKAYNITNARIAGFEVNFVGKGNAGPVSYTFNAGYTYTNPVDKAFAENENTASTDKNILKYRFYHNVKVAADVAYKKFSSGFNIDYHSYIVNIDLAFEDSLRVGGVGLPIFILPGLHEYRAKNNSGDVLVNWRFAWQPMDKLKLSFFINNLFNREYMTRPADVGPPRVFAMQVAVKI
jgi:iron complex outermembrane receptor protein